MSKMILYRVSYVAVMVVVFMSCVFICAALKIEPGIILMFLFFALSYGAGKAIAPYLAKWLNVEIKKGDEKEE